MTRTPVSTLAAALVAGALLSACSQPDSAATNTPAANTLAPTAAAAPQPANADVLRFKIGALDAVALKDGDIDVANDGKTFAIGQPADAVNALLTAAGQPTDTLHLSIQPLLVRSGAQVLLFDTGAADASFARAGRLPASLRAAGVEPRRSPTSSCRTTIPIMSAACSARTARSLSPMPTSICRRPNGRR
ncbi:MBL fold metallo-hydrolase [Lysobacter capsici]|uniref:hypothetical protein n=1 Tax=Lysobacter capsici TaxID=435897 RepID=UPI00398CE482